MKRYMILALALVMSAAAIPEPAEAMSTTVNCPGGSIGAALNAGFDEITVNGSCTEDVEIRQDDVTVQGSGTGGKLVGQLFLNGARRATIRNLTVEGSGTPESHGILVLNGANVAILSVLIENIPAGHGVHLENASSAYLDQVTIQNTSLGGVFAQSNSTVQIVNGSVIENSQDTGILLDLGSSGIVLGSTIQNNASTGVGAFRGSSAILGNDTIQGNPEGVGANTHSLLWLDGNTISTSVSPDSSALGVLWGSTAHLSGGNTFTSAGFAIFLEQGATLNQRAGDVVNGPVRLQVLSNAEFRNVRITGNIDVVDHSLIRIKDQSTGATQVSLKGNASISQDSGLNFLRDEGERQVRVVGNITCADTESSISAPTTNVTISGKTKGCTGYNYVSN